MEAECIPGFHQGMLMMLADILGGKKDFPITWQVLAESNIQLNFCPLSFVFNSGAEEKSYFPWLECAWTSATSVWPARPKRSPFPTGQEPFGRKREKME